MIDSSKNIKKIWFEQSTAATRITLFRTGVLGNEERKNQECIERLHLRTISRLNWDRQREKRADASHTDSKLYNSNLRCSRQINYFPIKCLIKRVRQVTLVDRIDVDSNFSRRVQTFTRFRETGNKSSISKEGETKNTNRGNARKTGHLVFACHIKGNNADCVPESVVC